MSMHDCQENKLLITLENLKRLTPRSQSSDIMPHGEFVTMFVIHTAMKQQEAGGQGEEGPYPGLMVSKLSELMQVSRPTASQMVGTLEDKGFIERVMSETDRRVIYICLTDSGKAAFGSRMELYSDVLAEIIEKVGREEIDQLIATCGRLMEAVNEVRPRVVSNPPMEQHHRLNL
ncbi:MarR family transcriptional regulator [Paenibacillus sp. MMS20-IR301]|uniref:MarR family winged helix-turn-helix transcriptional regulator n=1 Tax=Paenibacillus sp. MMS20-IR301 TaxID=2895946 RepID=UPI0028E4E383|nr:MarR family transcriptional regulator [Paenibacillus sp. MMS20-IR301]WNS46721.1 MarR family transcriptional regulator [Paenibacillus sp. MMS20-IR301]